MKKWQCMVCGYIHEGEEPPDECPVCGADKSEFVEITEEATEESPAEETAPAADTPGEAVPEAASATAASTATVGDDIPIQEEATPEPTPMVSKRMAYYDRITALMTEQHAHPISTHIPNGVLPISVIFLIMSILLHFDELGRAAFFNMVVVFLATPFVIFSGYNDWQRRLGGHMTTIIRTKMICAGIILVLSFIVVVWWAIDPTVATAASPNRWLFLFLNLVLLATAVVAGYFGGKLVFGYNTPPKQ